MAFELFIDFKLFAHLSSHCQSILGEKKQQQQQPIKQYDES